ncbi:MAG: hypothetical protein HOP11_04075 [Saprospiraceae bacterium]|nr:hypothetical protein [Saprospiraceae bacterium]
MKKIFLFSIYFLTSCFLITQAVSQQLCVNPPNCIQNGGLVAVPALGDMNQGANVANWWVSHGSPSCGGGTVWMWSYGGNGEGIFSCYNFVAGRTYNICYSAAYSGTNPNGALQIRSHSALVQNFNIGIPGFGTGNLIQSNPVTNPVMTNFSVSYTPTINHTQLWIYPFLLQDDGATQYAVNVDNVHIEDISIAVFTPVITASGPFQNGVPVTFSASGGPAGSVYTWSPSGIVGNTITVIPNCDKEQIISVTANYNNCPPPVPGICTRRSNVASITVIAKDCCSDTCYWKVTGNNIIGNNNIFGTLTPPNTAAADVRLYTSGVYRGIMDRFGSWGMGTSSGFLPNGKLQVHRTEKDRHIDVTGKAPSIKFYATETLPSTWPNSGPKIGLATSPNDFTNLSAVNDFVIENTSDADIIFGTNWLNGNSLERMKIDNKGEVGINTIASGFQDPTAFLHVNCTGNNTAAGFSDVRFESLESGTGKVMVINNSGYVFNSGITLPPVVGNVVSICTTANFIPKVQTTGSPNLVCSQVFDNGTNVGIGTTTPGTKLDVLANSTGLINVAVRAQATGTSTGINIGSLNTTNSTTSVIGIGAHSTTSNNQISIGATGWVSGSNSTSSKIGLWGTANANSCTGNNVGVYGQVNSTVGFCSSHFAGYFAGQTLSGGPALVISDSSLKTNIEDLQNGMEIINALQPRTYDFDSRVNSGFALTDKHQYGFISQELERVLPDVVTEIQGPASIDQNGNVTENSTKYKAINYDALIAVLVKGLQEQNERINALEEIVNNCCGENHLKKSSIMEGSKGIIDVKISENTVVLNQNVPNPFAESTFISYQIPESFFNAQIVFNNSYGQVIKVVEISESGKGGLNVYAHDLSSGHYTYSLVIDGKTVETKKMIKQE